LETGRGGARHQQIRISGWHHRENLLSKMSKQTHSAEGGTIRKGKQNTAGVIKGARERNVTLGVMVQKGNQESEREGEGSNKDGRLPVLGWSKLETLVGKEGISLLGNRGIAQRTGLAPGRRTYFSSEKRGRKKNGKVVGGSEAIAENRRGEKTGGIRKREEKLRGPSATKIKNESGGSEEGNRHADPDEQGKKRLGGGEKKKLNAGCSLSRG